MKDRELYGIDLPVTVRLFESSRRQPISQQMAMRIPGWVNFGILHASANLMLLNELSRT